MNETPHRAGDAPVAFHVKAGETYYWCACGKSKGQPLCDGSHVGTVFTPHRFEAEKDGTLFFCLCKRTARAPFCDGSHNDS